MTSDKLLNSPCIPKGEFLILDQEAIVSFIHVLFFVQSFELCMEIIQPILSPLQEGNIRHFYSSCGVNGKEKLENTIKNIPYAPKIRFL